MTFAYGKPLHRGKLMGPRCVRDLERAYIFIAAYNLKYRNGIVSCLVPPRHASRPAHSTDHNSFADEALATECPVIGDSPREVLDTLRAREASLNASQRLPVASHRSVSG